MLHQQGSHQHTISELAVDEHLHQTRGLRYTECPIGSFDKRVPSIWDSRDYRAPDSDKKLWITLKRKQFCDPESYLQQNQKKEFFGRER